MSFHPSPVAVAAMQCAARVLYLEYSIPIPHTTTRQDSPTRFWISKPKSGQCVCDYLSFRLPCTVLYPILSYPNLNLIDGTDDGKCTCFPRAGMYPFPSPHSFPSFPSHHPTCRPTVFSFFFPSPSTYHSYHSCCSRVEYHVSTSRGWGYGALARVRDYAMDVIRSTSKHMHLTYLPYLHPAPNRQTATSNSCAGVSQLMLSLPQRSLVDQWINGQWSMVNGLFFAKRWSRMGWYRTEAVILPIMPVIRKVRWVTLTHSLILKRTEDSNRARARPLAVLLHH